MARRHFKETRGAAGRACDWALLNHWRHFSPCGAQVQVLSGGEKARLALAKFMLTRGSLLVLDEPTNHLDIPSKETLESALREFQGSVIAVSHDRYFLKQIATRIIAVWRLLHPPPLLASLVHNPSFTPQAPLLAGDQMRFLRPRHLSYGCGCSRAVAPLTERG